MRTKAQLNFHTIAVLVTCDSPQAMMNRVLLPSAQEPVVEKLYGRFLTQQLTNRRNHIFVLV